MTSRKFARISRGRQPLQAGFTLIELLVGMAIGLLATLVVMQVFSVFETQKRSTAGGGDAMTNGNIALYRVSHDLQMAGYALTNTGDPGKADSAFECVPPVENYSIAGVAASAVSLSPVSITDGGSGAGGDSITIRFGTSNFGGLTTSVQGPWIGNAAPVGSSLGCASNDVALVINGPSCALTRLDTSTPTATTISFIDDRAATLAAKDSQITCLGDWNEITYSVDPATNNLLSGGNPTVEGIVNLQAQYGVSAPGLSSSDAAYNTVAAWVNADTAPWIAPGVTDRNRIKAVRLAIIARNAKREFETVTDICPSTNGTINKGPCVWPDSPLGDAPAVDLSADPDWQHYRYKVFETIVPLRNVLWAKGTLP